MKEKELKLKACPRCGTVVVGNNDQCKTCLERLYPIGAESRADGSVVFFELPKA